MRTLLSLFVLALALDAQPRRIVSTAPSFTETVYAIGAGDRVVGVSVHCHFPKEVETVAKVGTYIRPNVEAIVRLKNGFFKDSEPGPYRIFSVYSV